MHHIFVSYSRSDAAWVQSLVARLEGRGRDAWLDQADIPVTVPWMREVQDAIDEAALFLRCDSPAFRRSDSCSAEIGLAEQAAKPQFLVAVGDNPDACAEDVDRTIREISHDRARRTELRVLARDWDRAGRPRNRLVSGLRVRRLSRTLALPPAAGEVEHSFLRASRSKARRRVAIASIAAALTITSIGATLVFKAAQDTINTDNIKEATAYTGEREGLGLVAQDPYSGLAVASRDGGDDAAVHAEVISAALAEPTPDDAFTVWHARRFAVRPVGAEVIVVDASGRQWHRPVDATGTRAATFLHRDMPVTVAPTVDGLTARRSGSAGLVAVRKSGRLWRTVLFDSHPRALAFSPDGHFLAAAVGWQVNIVDLSTGQVRLRMRGATGELLDIAWSTDGRHIWALSDRRVVSWPTGNAYPLLDDRHANYNSILPAADPHAVWVVGAHVLREIDVSTGATLRRTTINDTINSAGAAPDGSVALASGDRHLWVVPLSRPGAPHHLDVKNCSLGRATFRDDTTAYLPCIGGVLMTLSMPSARVTATVAIPASGAFGVRAVPGTGVVYVGDRTGYLYAVEGSRVSHLFASECDADLARVAVAPDGRAALAVGSGSGTGTCTRIGLRGSGDPADPGSWTWNAVLEEQESSIYATAVTFNRTGNNFAIGYSDGTITMHPTENLLPTITINTAVGAIRDMLMLNDGNLIVATNAGMVERIPFCDSCLSDAALSKIAAAHLARASRLGLAYRKR